MRSPVVELETIIDGDVDAVWRALTMPELIKKYLFGAEVITDWEVGHPITFRGEWNGKPFTDRGEIRTIDPGHELSYTHWSELEGESSVPQHQQLVRYRLASQGALTKLTLAQFNMGGSEPDEKKREEYRRNWKAMLDGLRETVEAGAAATSRH